MVRLTTGGILGAALIVLAGPALADLAVTANDSHSANTDGVLGPAKNLPPDTVSIIDVEQYPPKVVSTVDAPPGAKLDIGSGPAAIRTPSP